MKTKETSFFRKLIMSIKNIEKYPELASKKIWISILYMIKLLVIFVAIVSFCSVYKIAIQIKQTISYISTEVPNFILQDNKLYVEEDKVILAENEDSLFELVILDANYKLDENKIQEYKQKLKNVTNGIIFLNDKVILKTDNIIGDSIEYSYSTITQIYDIENFNKQDVLNYFSGSNLIILYIGIFIFTFIYIYILYLISTFLDVVLLGIFGYITAIFVKLRLRYLAMCKVAIHSLTLPILLHAIAIVLKTFGNFTINYFKIMYIGISCIYIVASILMIKSDVIKNGQELARIIEEQVRIKQEMEREEERKKQEEDDKRKNEKKKKDRKKEDKEDNLGEEPQGENA